MLRNRGRVKRKILSTTGEVIFYRQQYTCRKCKKYIYPTDEILEITSSMASKRCAKAISLTASFVPFEHTKNFLSQMLMLNVSETCIEGITHRVGAKIYHDADMKGRHPYDLCKEKKNPKRVYAQTDGAMVPICGENEVIYKENKLGIVYKDTDIVRETNKNGEERVVIKNKHYVSSLGEDVDKFKKMLYAQCIERGAKKAEEVIILGDGAPWINKFKEEYFPDAVQILDWYHAVEHLWVTAHKLFGENDIKRCEEWVNPLKALLWDGKVDTVIEKVTQEALSRKKNQTPLLELRAYYLSRKNHMKYDEFRLKGYNIGSGAIESANKYIVGQRLKLSGMKWTISHANAMIHLRCKYYEGNWDAFWENINLKDYLDHELIKKSKVS